MSDLVTRSLEEKLDVSAASFVSVSQLWRHYTTTVHRGTGSKFVGVLVT